MSFVKDKKIGKIGEAIVEKLIREVFNMDLIDVSEDSYWQQFDVDFLVDDIQVEVKTDTSITPNIFFETVSNKSKGTKGCMLITTADILYYVHTGHEIIFTIPVDEYRLWVMNNQSSMRTVSVRTSNAEGILVPIKRLLNEIETVSVMTLDYKPLTTEQTLKIIGVN